MSKKTRKSKGLNFSIPEGQMDHNSGWPWVDLTKFKGYENG